jgi:hypothetical protein
MTKFTADGYLDGFLMQFSSDASRLDVCLNAPASYAAAVGSDSLANVTLSSDDYTLADGDASGRKITVGAQNGITVTGTGTATHIALTNGADTLIYYTECNNVALSSDGTVDIAAFDIEIADPA